MIKETSSFRDPDARLWYDNHFYYRQMSLQYGAHFDFFITSGLSKILIDEGILLPFNIIKNESLQQEGFDERIIQTEKIPFVSYPYEWSFTQFKTAALLTVKINLIALKYGMILKDASMFNVQFIGCKPVFIDLSSFEIYEEGKPWQAYYQFCKHFYAPLFLASKRNLFLPKLLSYFIDGIPLKEAISMSSWKDFFRTGPFFHLYLHAKGEGKSKIGAQPKKIEKKQLVSILQHLELSIENFEIPFKTTTWRDYNLTNNYTTESKEDKKSIIDDFLSKIEGKKALDIGANDGTYSQLLAAKGMYTLVVDIDEIAVDKAYQTNAKEQSRTIHPLHINLANPTPAIGWNNLERKSFWDRCKVDVIQALAIVHHLNITHDISFEAIAEQLAQHTKYLIIEFISPDDSQAQILLDSKPHHRTTYNQENFENSFGRFFQLIDKRNIDNTLRCLYIYCKEV